MTRKQLITVTVAVIAVAAAIIYWTTLRGGSVAQHSLEEHIVELEPEKTVLYGIEYDPEVLTTEDGVVKSGESISTIFARYGVSAVMVDRTVKASADVFDLRKIRAGKKYTAFITADSLARLRYFVYEHTLTDFVRFSFEGDSVRVDMDHKDVAVNRRKGSGTITSSLWNSMIAGGMSPALAMEMEEVYQWTVDFFGIQEGDHFTVIYDDREVDGESIGAGQIWGALFHHNGKDYYAIPFKQEGRVQYWDEQGNSLRKAMLKAPLQYSRISSKFSPSRMHPVLRIRRPHYGVDYAAPSGTPVKAVANGTVTFAGWDSKGGGNTIKIRHTKGLETGYLHLRGFAKGVKSGARVNQGDVIGYVGSTGTSTGPHLDYRVWRNGKPVDPLKMTSEPGDPIASVNREPFEFVKERILAELRGELPDSLRITQLDSVQTLMPKTEAPSPAQTTL